MSSIYLAESAAQFVQAATIKQTVTYLDLVTASVLIYDYFLTVKDEVELVWPARWNLGKILFFLTRYPPFLDTTLILVHQFALLSPRQCGAIYRTIGYMLGAGIGVAELILTMRTVVIWGRDRRVAFGTTFLLAALWVPMFFFLNESLSSLVFTTPPRPDMPGCFLLTQKNILFICFIIIMSFETVILALTFIKGLDHFRHTSSPLISVLYRDGILNYFYLFALSVVNVGVLLGAPRGYTTLMTALQRVMHSILSARILLHLKAANRNPAHVYRREHSPRFRTAVSGSNTHFTNSPTFEFVRNAIHSRETETDAGQLTTLLTEKTFGDGWFGDEKPVELVVKPHPINFYP